METTRLSRKGYVTIPKAVRIAHRWGTGLELTVTDTGDGVLLKPKAPFPNTVVRDVAGMLRDKVRARTDDEIGAELQEDARNKWRRSD